MILLNIPSTLNLYSETIVRTATELNPISRLSFPGIDALQAAGIVVTPLFATILNNSDQDATNLFITKDSEQSNCAAFTVPGGGGGNCFYQQEGGFSYMLFDNPLGAVYLTITINVGAGSLTFTMYYAKSIPVV